MYAYTHRLSSSSTAAAGAAAAAAAAAVAAAAVATAQQPLHIKLCTLFMGSFGAIGRKADSAPLLFVFVAAASPPSSHFAFAALGTAGSTFEARVEKMRAASGTGIPAGSLALSLPRYKLIRCSEHARLPLPPSNLLPRGDERAAHTHP